MLANGQEGLEQRRVCSYLSVTSCFLLCVLLKLAELNGKVTRERAGEAGWG